jgi:Dimerisation domain
MSEKLDLSPISQTAFSFWSSKGLLSAVELGVFTALRDRKLTGAELADEVRLHPRALSDFFDAMAAMKFLEREGDSESNSRAGSAAACYSNTPLIALCLGRNSSRYIGLIRHHASPDLTRLMSMIAGPGNAVPQPPKALASFLPSRWRLGHPKPKWGALERPSNTSHPLVWHNLPVSQHDIALIHAYDLNNSPV